MAENTSEAPLIMENEEFLPGYPTCVSFTQASFGKLVKATQKAHGLPSTGDDFEFYSSYPDFRDFCKAQGSRLLSDVGKLMKFQHVKCRWSSDLEDEPSMEIDDMFESLVEANDILLEQVDSCLDEASGLRKNKKPVLPPSMQQGNPVVSSWNKSSHQSNRPDNKLRFLHAKNILRPQLKFKESPDNSNVPFIPIIKEKPNALKPLENYKPFETDISEDAGVPAALANFIHAQRTQEYNKVFPSHPYQYELEEFIADNDAMSICEPEVYKALENTQLTYVDNVEKLTQLLSVLKGVTEFAVDLEHHSFRSFQGFVCLMQISTRDEDYLVDTLELRTELSQLNEVFTNPNILKVLHGADMDIGWLQRDFGIYMVNMFDTGQATRVLEYPRFSLAFLLKKFCDVTANKQYQLADWRIRPLPTEMELYAREDTHYLIYVYDRLRNELILKGNENNNLIESVYRRSKDVCLKTYEKPIFTTESYLALYRRHKKTLNCNQREAFRLLYGWRDEIARLEDESYAYVLPNHMLFGIAEELPKASQGVLACCNPVPTLVRQNINEIHRLILQARDLDPSLSGPLSASSSTIGGQMLDPVVKMDVSGPPGNNKNKQGDDVDVKHEPLTPFKDLNITGPAVYVAQPAISLFLCQEQNNKLTEGEKKAKAIQESFKNPYQAFLPTKVPESTKSSDIINEQWKKKSEQMIKESGNKEKVIKDEDKTTKRKSGSAGSEEDALRQPKNKKKKNSTREMKVSEVTNEKDSLEGNAQFVPFDYSAAGLNFGEEGSEGEKKDIFNPYKKLNEKSKQFGSKVHMKSGQRTSTFSKKK